VFGERKEETRQIFRLHQPVDNLISSHVAGQERDHLELLRSGMFGNADQENEPDRHLAEGYRLRTGCRDHDHRRDAIGSRMRKRDASRK
jgi:hypothetical protein